MSTEQAGQRRLGIGVVGINDRIRRSILSGIAQSQVAELAAVCSRDADKARRVASEYCCRAYSTLNDMLADDAIDAVFVATPPDLHCQMSLSAIAAGKHVICEKPLATSEAQALLMVQAARDAGVRTAVNFTYRSGQLHRHVAALAEEGVLGSVGAFRVSYWQARGLLPGTLWRDALADLGPHLFDSALWWLSLAGAGAVAAVCALRRGPDPSAGFADGSAWHCLVETTSGATGVVEVGRAVPGYANGLQAEMSGNRGALRLSFDAAGGAVELAVLGDARPEGAFRPIDTPPDFAVSYEEFPRRHMSRIAEGILGRIEFPGFDQGLRVQRVIEAAARSAAEGRWERVAG